MSLPGIFKTTLATIPARIPYVQAPAEVTETQAQVLDSAKDFKIGIVWQGNPKTWDPDLQRSDALRSVSLANFEPLAHVPGARLISLQKGARSPNLSLTDWTNELNDFANTAALIANLDLVISADTAVAHLAGAMGKPLFLLLPFAADFRWLRERTDSPWYPTARLFRQPRFGDWDGAVNLLRHALMDFAVRWGRAA